MFYLNLFFVAALGDLTAADEELLLVQRTPTYPEGFFFSAATSSYQVEGAWNFRGKGESIWDRLVHKNPNYVADKSNGDVACDSYQRYAEDIQLLKSIGFNMYRFSLSWPRIFPNGSREIINKEAVQRYHDIIDELLSNGIQPMVTIYHWDLPQALEDLGGWLNDEIIKYYLDYADFVFGTYGDKVKWWITINEPTSISDGYGTQTYAPALDRRDGSNYKVAHNLLKAHANAYHLYKEKYGYQHGKASICLQASYCYPKNASNEEDHRAADRLMEFETGWFAHPIYNQYGDYPSVMRDLIDKHSAQEGRRTSRLPYFTYEEIENIRGTYDYLAINHYTSALCTDGRISERGTWPWDSETMTSRDPSWPSSQSSWLKVVPEGFRHLLVRLKEVYNDPEIFVSENGFSEGAEYDDQGRIKYLKSYMSEMLKAINEDGVNVKGYTVWSLLDNFEWKAGYSQQFGLVHVNMSDPNRKRTMKASAKFMKNYIAVNSPQDG